VKTHACQLRLRPATVLIGRSEISHYAEPGWPHHQRSAVFFFSYEGSGSTILYPCVSDSGSPGFRQYGIAQNPGSIATQLFSTPRHRPRISSVGCTEKPLLFVDSNYGLANGTWLATDQARRLARTRRYPRLGVYDLTLPNTSSGNQYNGRVDYTRGQSYSCKYLHRPAE